MKKLILSASLLAISMISMSQTVNDKKITDLDVSYVRIVGTERLLSTKITVEIDFGQESKYFNPKGNQIKDTNGKLIVFNSMIDALNFMCLNGFEYVNAHTVTVGNQNVYNYILKKK